MRPRSPSAVQPRPAIGRLRAALAAAAALLALAVAVPVRAQDAAGLPEAYIAVQTGRLQIDASGQVRDVRFDQAIPAVDGRLRDRILAWRFEPVREGGAPVAAETRVRLRLSAVTRGQAADIRLEQVDFVAVDGGRMPSGRGVPRLPTEVIEANAQGVVELVLELGADGRVLQAAPVRVRLTADALREDHHARRDHLARLLGDAYAQQALAWRYPIADAGPPQAALRRLRVPAEITLQQVAPGQRRPPPPFLGPAWRRVVPVDLAAPGWTSASLPAGAEVTLSDTGALPDARIRKLGGAGTGAL